jgi:hypothetical protein
MKEEKNQNIIERKNRPMRLPGFVLSEDTGFGDVIKQVTYALGIPACSGCIKRAAVLNRWLVIPGRNTPRK